MQISRKTSGTCELRAPTSVTYGTAETDVDCTVCQQQGGPCDDLVWVEAGVARIDRRVREYLERSDVQLADIETRVVGILGERRVSAINDIESVSCDVDDRGAINADLLAGLQAETPGVARKPVLHPGNGLRSVAAVVFELDHR